MACACQGVCIPNTFLHFPEVDIRLGIAGDELYAEDDIDSGRLVFVFTGKMTSLKKYLKTVKDNEPDLYAIFGRWQGEKLNGIGRDGIPSFVIRTINEIAGFANHSCDPNMEVYEIWQNGKLYIVAKTIKYCFAGDILTYDYEWEYSNEVKYAEICLCGSKNCRAFIAKVPCEVMQRSIPRYVAILNEMETHNTYESQRLDRLMTALHANHPLTNQERQEVGSLKRDVEELRLTQKKAILLKKGILMAKAILAELENEEKLKSTGEKNKYLGEKNKYMGEKNKHIGERNKYLDEHEISHAQRLPEFENELMVECLQESRKQSLPDSDEELDYVSTTSKTLTSNSSNSFGKKDTRSETSTSMKNLKEHCVSESRITRALNNDGLPLTVKIPLPLKDDDECVLMGVQDIDKLLEESKILSENKKNFYSSNLCFSPPHSRTSLITSSSSTSMKSDPYSISTPRLNQYESAMKSSRIIDTDETLNRLNSKENVIGTKQETKGKEKATSSTTTNLGELQFKRIEDWGEGLFTQDEISRIFHWVEGTLHARGESSQCKPWPDAKKWAFWLHKNFRHPTRVELENHSKTWVGMSTKTLRAGDSGKIAHAKTIPLVRDVNTLLSDVLTFIPFKFSGFRLVESKKSGKIWRFVPIDGALPGNPTFRTSG